MSFLSEVLALSMSGQDRARTAADTPATAARSRKAGPPNSPAGVAPAVDPAAEPTVVIGFSTPRYQVLGIGGRPVLRVLRTGGRTWGPSMERPPTSRAGRFPFRKGGRTAPTTSADESAGSDPLRSGCRPPRVHDVCCRQHDLPNLMVTDQLAAERPGRECRQEHCSD